ncbi:MAG: hypothetical protein JWP97_5043 [Labilithrix sp.]|nr:hypothetical protein [Labilithrix sp.]
MASNIVETLGKELEQVDREYASDFAGHSRLTRDVDQIDRMIKRVAAVVSQIERIPAAAQGPDLQRMRDAASSSLTLYKNEKTAILQAQQVGPAFEQFSMEATAANFTFGRYLRHFAGQDRGTRDAALLGELVDDLRQIDKRMTALLEQSPKSSADFAKDRAVVRENLTQYQKEIELVEAAQKTGTPEEQASILATLANNQFSVYQTHFAGEPRISRRPALMMRVVGSLMKIRERMAALKVGGLAVEFNDKNMAIVDERLAVYENELTEIRKLRQATSMTDIMGELGAAANKLFEEYKASFADKPRTQADPKRLSNICDKLGEVRRQMADLSRAEESEMNLKNLDIVTEQLVMFETEFEQVVRAQAQK